MVNPFKSKKRSLDINVYSSDSTFTETPLGLLKTCSNHRILDWETCVYFYLEDHAPSITPKMEIDNTFNTVLYKTHNTVSLKQFLKKNIKRYSCIINELISFVKTFKDYNFTHGNLHMSNILVDTLSPTFKFYVIDLSNSFIPDLPAPDFKRSSFSSNYIPLENCDLTTLYHSITHHFAVIKTNKTILNHVTKLFEDHIVF